MTLKETNNKAKCRNLLSEFLKYYTNIDAKLNIELSLKIFSDNCCLSRDILFRFLESAVGFYNDIPYHNATHALNTLYTGSIFLQILDNYELDSDTRFIFLICCYLHDIDHPGLNEYFTRTLDYEYHHINFVKELLTKYFPQYITDQNIDLISDLILATNLIKHDEILAEFDFKYSQNEDVTRSLGSLELKMLIKLADISASYKNFDSFLCGSTLLEQEIFGPLKKCANKIQEDYTFLQNFSLPLAEKFSNVFIDFKFLHENALENLRRIKELIK